MLHLDQEEISPNERSEVLKAAASAYAYNKTNLQKLKSKLGTIIHNKRKEVGKQITSYAISKIPIVGTELKFLFNQGISYAEGVYKKRKMDKLKNQSEEDYIPSEAILAEIKYLSFENYLKEIEESYRKVMATIETINASDQSLNYCSDFVEAFYKFYRVEDRMNKLFFKVDVIKNTLLALEENLKKQYDHCLDYRDKLIEQTNLYTESHFDKQCLNHSSSRIEPICINDVNSMEKLIKKGEHEKLIGLEL